MIAPFARLALAGVLSLSASGAVLAQADPKTQELIRRGDAVLTLGDLDGRMSRLAETERAIHARDSSNLSRMIDRLLVNRQLAIEARELGLDDDPDVRTDMALAVEEVLATHRLNLLVRRDRIPDFTELARERYLADPGSFGVPELRRVVHVLIDTEDRSEQEALALASQVREQATSGQVPFRELVEQYSDDGSKDRNQGHFTIQRDGEFVPEFEAAARSLAAPGDVSAPIKTRYGYHIIKLLELEPARPASFEDIRDGLVDELRDAYINEIRGKHAADLRGLVDQGNEELMLTLPARYGGRPEETGNASTPAGAPADAGR
jgi:parvulin-like peptidyl-prolyl isomerase